VFILENVKNFKFIESGKPFNYLIKQLKNIKNINGDLAYNIYHDILNTKDYGIPQNRERIFFIGIRKDIQTNEYTTPKKLPMKPLDDFIIDKTICNLQISKSLNNNLKKIKDVNSYSYIVTPFTFYSIIKNLSPTLTTQCHCYFNTKYKRNLTPTECLLLQGFSNNFRQVVSNTQLYKQAGNSMSVNVLKALIKKIYTITNL
jgi:DNA (cytosine-5)-methyltransferase 1